MPIAIVAIAAPWTIKLTKLPAVRKLSFIDWKTMEITTSPTTMGSDPSSPLRKPRAQFRA